MRPSHWDQDDLRIRERALREAAERRRRRDARAADDAVEATSTPRRPAQR